MDRRVYFSLPGLRPRTPNEGACASPELHWASPHSHAATGAAPQELGPKFLGPLASSTILEFLLTFCQSVSVINCSSHQRPKNSANQALTVLGSARFARLPSPCYTLVSPFAPSSFFLPKHSSTTRVPFTFIVIVPSSLSRADIFTMASTSSIDKGSKVDIPAFTPTAVDSIPGTCSAVRAGFRTLKTKDLEYRKVQLRKLYWGIKDHGTQLEEALMRDLRKSAYESRFAEIDWTANDCMYMLDNLDKFAKDEYPDVPFVFKTNKVRIHKEPLGSALIIGTYNFPFMLTVVPLVGAIAAGCTAVLKPSEGAPNVAMVIKSIVESCLDPEAYRVVNGAVPETTALLDQKWDKIFYTGSANVARIICKRAAENLTPVTLELGGRNPAFVTRNADLKLAAKRLLWAKTLCAGQVCLSQNYVLVERETVDEFIKQLNAASKQAFPQGAKASPDLCRVVNERHFLRMKKMVDESKGKIVMGGEMDQSELFIAPTAVLVNSVDDSMMKEESFGPVFCIIPFDNLGDAIDIANNVDPTPLALFGFGTREEFERRMLPRDSIPKVLTPARC